MNVSEGALKNPGSTHASADAHSRHTVAFFFLSHGVQHRCSSNSTRGTERMSQCDSTAARIDDMLVQFELIDNSEALCSKGFVEFNPLDVFEFKLAQMQGFRYGGYWANAHDFGRHADNGVADETLL